MFSTKTTIVALFSLLYTTTLALPTAVASPQESASGPIQITLIDATGHQYPVSIPITNTYTPTNIKESISHVHISNTGPELCVFYGVDGAKIVELPNMVKDMDVGPPQTIVGGICGPCHPGH
jgi:hypothetical protein